MVRAARLAVVLGVGPGVGQAICRRFGREGYQVVLASRRPARLARIAATLGREDVDAIPLGVDVSDLTALRDALKGVVLEHGDPEVLVYNAAHGPAIKPTHIDPDALVEAMSVNVVGALVAAQAVAEPMRLHGRGTILFTGEAHALSPHPEAAVLGMGKAALRNLTFTLAQELEPDGIHVATVTVNGTIAPRTPFDPRHVAEAFWRLHTEPAGEWSTELVFRGRI